MDEQRSFGQLVKNMRRQLGLTQDELARRVGCAPVTLRKVEYDELRPSVQIAERLGMALNIPLEERASFVHLARNVPMAIEASPIPAPKPEEIGIEDLSGHAIRGYTLGELIAKGGMGVVYRGVQPLVEREVAIKIILPQYANHPDFIRRFEAEAQLVARLEHPHIIPLYDYWREPNVAFLVMRLLRGGSLEKLLESGPLPLSMTLSIMEQICSALALAHRAGVIHRDLKPANILLDEDQNAYLADFGIAKNLGNPFMKNLTQADAIVGSPKYISPEQIRCEVVRPQSDIYCLGVVLYEMLTGQTPFTGPTPIEVMQQHLCAPLPPLAARRSGLPGALDAVIQRATLKDPLARYPDVESFMSDLRQAMPGAPAVAAPASPAPALPPLTEADNPYKGLRAFGEVDAEDFFGREALTHQLLIRLGEGGDLSRLLAVIGPSGSGKSSVVKAGLLPALRRGGLPGSENWFIVDLMPGAHPFEELEAALLRIAVNPPSALLDQLRSDRRGLLRAVNRCLPEDPAVELLLVLDQFEEVFTLVEDEAEREALLDSLVTAALDEHSRLRIVLTLRADFTGRPLQYVDFGELLRQRMEVVLPLTPDELEQAILGPAGRVGLAVEPGLVIDILRDMGSQPGTLPLLQYALTELFERREGRTLTRRAYQQIGGVTGALVQRAEAVFTGLGAEAQAATRQIFLRLVTLGEGASDTRRRPLRGELISLNPQAPPPAGPVQRPSSVGGEAVLETFGRARLLLFDRDQQTRGPTVELAHEALLSQWQRLHGWLDESRDDLRTQRRLAAAAGEWAQAGRASGYLAAGERLVQFQALAARGSLALTPDEQAYLEASGAEQERQRQVAEAQTRREHRLEQRAQRVLVALLGIFLLAALISGGLAVWANTQRLEAETQRGIAETQRLEADTQRGIAEAQRQEALRQASIGLAAQAVTQLDTANPERATLLALEALQDYPYTAQAESALARAVQESLPFHEWFLEDESNGFAEVAASPDGRWVAAFDGWKVGQTGRLQVWDVAQGEIVRAWPVEKAEMGKCFALDLVWSPDSARLALSTPCYVAENSSVQVYAAETGQELFSLTPGERVDWSADDQRLLTFGGGGVPEVRLWDAQTGALLDELPGYFEAYTASFAPDSTRVAIGYADGTVAVWDLQSGAVASQGGTQALIGVPLTGTQASAELAAEFQTFLEGVAALDWSPDGSRLAAGYENGLVRVWQAAPAGAGYHQAFVLSDLSEMVVMVQWSPDGRYLAVGSQSKGIYLYSASGNLALKISTGGLLDFSADSRYLLVASGKAIRFWDLSFLPLQVSPALVNPLDTSCGWSPDGRSLATSSGVQVLGQDATVQVWPEQLGNLGWSPDSTRVVGQVFQGPRVKILDVRTGQVLVESATQAESETVYFFGSDWSADGRRVVADLSDFATGTSTLVIWDPQTGLELARTSAIACYMVFPNFSPDGALLAAGCAYSPIQGTTYIFDGVTGVQLHELQDDSGSWVHAAVWSPDGRSLVATHQDGLLSIWDTATWKVVQTLSAHQGGVVAAAWSPDSQRLLTGDGTGQAYIWDLATGQVVQSIRLSGDIAGGDWSPDGQWVALVGWEDFVFRRAWPTTAALIAYAEENFVTRELTPEERQTFGLPVKP